MTGRLFKVPLLAKRGGSALLSGDGVLMIFQKKCRLKKKLYLNEDCFMFTFSAPEIAASARPGQFVTIGIPDNAVFLRRPFSVAGVHGSDFSIVFRKKGAGTIKLASSDEGNLIDIMGPLGAPYPVSRVLHKTPVFISGGIGIASLLYPASSAAKIYTGKKKPVFLAGVKTKSEILFSTELKKMKYELSISTDDGSAGYKGTVLDSFCRRLLSGLDGDIVVFSCGPREMLRELARMCFKKNIECYISVEEKMACGTGACQGCAVKIIKENSFEYKRACCDGPVFEAKTILWD